MIAIVAYFRWVVPSSRLTPDLRLRREERRAGGTIGVLAGCTVLGALSATAYLTTWSQWLVLGSYFFVAFGVGLMLHVRFTIGA